MDRVINKLIDKDNLAIYEKYGIKNSSQYRHRCVLCEQPTSIDGCISMQGKKLICNKCARYQFKNLDEAFRWVLEEEEGL